MMKLHRERAVDAVYQAIRQAILSSRMKPGERLNIDELAAKLGVSLTPVRGAIQQLSTEGLIEIRPRSGTFVARLTGRDVEETVKIKTALECLAAEEVIANLTENELTRLRQCDDIHDAIVQASGNRRLLETYEGLNAHLSIARILAEDRGWTANAVDNGAHAEIVNALAARDSSLTCSLIRRQADALMASLLSALHTQLRDEPQPSPENLPA